MIDDLMDGL